MKFETLDDLYLEQLRDLYSAEKQITKALPKMMKKASSDQLKSGFEKHLQETEMQQDRLEQIFEKLGKKGSGHVCKAMQGIIEECKEWMDEDATDGIMDAGLIANAQRIEHYEMAGYATAHRLAMTLGYSDHAKLLEKSLKEETATDNHLSQLAESEVNMMAEATR
ncbi:MAG: ferritin-like domain-containing protein [Bacteroidota bacterium]|nr:ferritin-like domain-containing protein [Bacteroidota bacterium]